MFASAAAFFTKDTSFPRSKLIPLIIQLGDYLRVGFEHYVQIRLAGKTMTVETLQMFIYIQMRDWNPVVNGSSLLDNDTKQAASRFLAGVAINLFNDGE